MSRFLGFLECPQLAAGHVLNITCSLTSPDTCKQVCSAKVAVLASSTQKPEIVPELLCVLQPTNSSVQRIHCGIGIASTGTVLSLSSRR